MQVEVPLIERELLRAGRHSVTYAARVIVPAMVLVMVALASFYALILGGTVDSNAIATYLSVFVTMGQAGIAYLLAPWIASRAIADEAANNSLDLVTLADKSHAEFYAGKFMGVWLQAVALLLSLIPVQVLSAAVDASTSDPVVGGLIHYAIRSAFMCAIALFYSALFRRAGLAYVATLGTFFLGQTFLATLYDWAPLGVQTLWARDDVSSVALALIAILAGIGTLVLLRHPEFDVRNIPRRRKRLPMHIPANPVSCVARIVQCEGGGIATFARTWKGRAMVACLLAMLAFLLHAPSASIFLGAFIAAESYVVGRDLRRRHVIDDLVLTAIGARGVGFGILQGQFARSLVFFPAVVFCGDLPSLAESAFSVVQRGQVALGIGSEDAVTLAGIALLLSVAIAYAWLLIYLFSAVGIHYAAEGCSAGRMALNLLGLYVILSTAISMTNVGYFMIAQKLSAMRVFQPQPMFGNGWGEILAGLIILPVAIVDYRRRIARQFDQILEGHD